MYIKRNVLDKIEKLMNSGLRLLRSEIIIVTLDEVAGDMSVGGLDYEVVGNRFDNPELLELLEV